MDPDDPGVPLTVTTDEIELVAVSQPTSSGEKEPKLRQRTLFDFRGFSGNANSKNEFSAKGTKRVICRVCGDIIGKKGSLFMHMKFKHKKEAGNEGEYNNITDELLLSQLLSQTR